MTLSPLYLDDVLRRALLEDIPYLDVTTDNLIDEDSRAEAVLLCKEPGVLCGLEAAGRAFALLGPGVQAEYRRKDGGRVQKGDVAAVFRGPTNLLLKGERTALNLVQHMSGIATATAEAVARAAGTCATVTDTRKTLPGLRALEKYAVTVGGGRNHRFGLSDAALIKDNHIDACGSIAAAVERLRGRVGHMVKIEVETRTLDEVQEALGLGVDAILLDNMSLDDMRAAVALSGGRALMEASGNITLETIGAVAQTGVDIISMGALTHSVRAMDISLKLRRAAQRA